MDSKRKQDISLILLSVLCSVLVSIVIVGTLCCRFSNTNAQEITQTATQTVTINEQESPSRVNLNRATAHELMSLPGIGATLAERIIEARPFYDVWQLADVEGIGGATLRNILEKVEVE